MANIITMPMLMLANACIWPHNLKIILAFG